MVRHELAFTLTLLAAALVGLVFVIPRHTGGGFGGEGSLPASFMPNLAAGGIAVLLGVRLLAGLRRGARAGVADPFAGAAVGRAAATAAVLGAAVFGAIHVGVLAVTPFLAVAVMAILGERRWKPLLAMAIALPLALHLVFERLLGATL